MANARTRDIKSALGSSLRAEETSVSDRQLDRFARAEAVMDSRAGKSQASERQRVIRDSFTLPADDYSLLSTLRNRGLKGGVHANKSELVRAGLRMLLELSDKEFLFALEKVEKIKTGRPTEKTV